MSFSVSIIAFHRKISRKKRLIGRGGGEGRIQNRVLYIIYNIMLGVKSRYVLLYTNLKLTYILKVKCTYLGIYI